MSNCSTTTQKLTSTFSGQSYDLTSDMLGWVRWLLKNIGWFKFDYIKLVQTTLKFQCLVLDSDIQLDFLSVMPQQHDEHQKPQQQQQQQQHDQHEQPQQQLQEGQQPQQKRKVDLEEEPSAKRICKENKSK